MSRLFQFRSAFSVLGSLCLENVTFYCNVHGIIIKKNVPHIPAKLSRPLFLYSDVNKTSRRINHNNTLFFLLCKVSLHTFVSIFLKIQIYNLLFRDFPRA